MKASTFQSDLDISYVVGLLHFKIFKCKHPKCGTITSPYEYNMNDDGSHSKLLGFGCVDNICSFTM